MSGAQEKRLRAIDYLDKTRVEAINTELHKGVEVMKWILLPFFLFVLIFCIIGIPIEFILTFWMAEPVTFYRDSAKVIIDSYRDFS